MIDSCSGRADFAALRQGRRYRSETLQVTFAADATLLRPRAAFAFSRRAGSAVQRNRARRRLRAVLRELAPDMRPGRYLFGTRGAASALTYRRTQAEMRELLTEAGALT